MYWSFIFVLRCETLCDCVEKCQSNGICFHAFFLHQSPSIPSGRCVRESSLRFFSVILRAALTPTAASASTMVSTWSPWIWCQGPARRREPGSPASSTWWPASAMRTAWPRDSAPVINILDLSHEEIRKERLNWAGDGERAKAGRKFSYYVLLLFDKHTQTHTPSILEM